ncbi:tetratricopeptide repeat protein 23-like [Macrobrachium rosenbergii]|uniref:tetratricopeptide repeat protein 23-like n=1 Tax=Macrobrachium rosenbergii TaxID=79674 RepID=UPI0034D53173
MSDSDPDFWDLGQDEPRANQRRRARGKKSKGFPDFPINVPDNVDKGFSSSPQSSHENNGKTIPNYVKSIGNQKESDAQLIENADHSSSEDDEKESQEEEEGEGTEEEESVDDDSESNTDEEEEVEEEEDIASNHNDIKDEVETRSSSESSNRTSLLTGSDLPQDSPKEAILTDESAKSSKGSLSESRWVVEEYLLPPQQKLKLALYRGRKLLAAKEADSAVREFVRAQALARIVHGDQHWRYCRCKVFLAQAYLYLKQYAPQGEAQSREALDTINLHFATPLAPSKKPQVHHTLLWGYLVCGEARTILGQLVGAQESLSLALHHTQIYTKMISKRKKRLTPSLTMDRALDLQVKVLCAQATLYKKRRKFTKAKERLELTISTIEKEGTGPEDPGLVGPLQQLGQLLLEGGGQTSEDDSEKGLQCLARAVNITQVSNRPGSTAECEARGLLVEHRLRLRRIETQEALRELHKLGILYARIHGEQSPKSLAIYNLTIQVLLQEEDYEQAIQHLRTRLKLCREAHGDYSPQVCGVLKQLSRVHSLNNDLNAAASALDQCLHTEILIYGSSSRRAQASRLRLREIIQHLPLAQRMKMWRKHPELQNKPRFRNL